MAESYLTGFDAFELRTQGGGAVAQEWVDNNHSVTFTSLGQSYDITDPNGDVEFHDDDADQTPSSAITFGTKTYLPARR